MKLPHTLSPKPCSLFHSMGWSAITDCTHCHPSPALFFPLNGVVRYYRLHTLSPIPCSHTYCSLDVLVCGDVSLIVVYWTLGCGINDGYTGVNAYTPCKIGLYLTFSCFTNAFPPSCRGEFTLATLLHRQGLGHFPGPPTPSCGDRVDAATTPLHTPRCIPGARKMLPTGRTGTE